MIRIAEQVSRAIRILRGNRDESARASHLVVNKDQFVNNELLQIDQAEREKCSQSTFSERKIMKTAFKRVALVAAAALAIGGVTAVSANAVGVFATNTNLNCTTATLLTPSVPATVPQTYAAGSSCTQIAGPANTVTLTNAAGSGVYFTITGGTTTGGASSGTVAPGTLSISTPTVGTITVTGYLINPLTGTAATTATDTVTITVTAALPGTVYSSSTVFGASGVATGITTDGTFPVVAPAAVAAPAVAAASFTLTENDAAGVALTSGFKAFSISATIGTIVATGYAGSGTQYVTGTPAAVVPAASVPVNFAVFSNGLAGTSTVTVSVNGVAVKSYSVVFSGVAAKIILTAINPVVGITGATGLTANVNALEVQEVDAAGNPVAVNGAITLTPASSSIATAGSPSTAVGVLPANYLGNTTSGTALSATVGGSTVVGVAAGTTTFTATDGTLVSNSVTVRVSAAVPTSVVFSTDAATYASGGAGTLTTTLSDSAGTIPQGTYTVLTAAGASASYALTVGTANLPGAAITVNDAGVATAAFNAPISDATAVTISGTAAASTITVTPATFSVSSGASDAANAATDAANEATDAANAATDAANAAADSADAATQAAQDAGDKADAALAAVTALSQQVTTLLAKVAALASTLAKITAAIAKLPKK